MLLNDAPSGQVSDYDRQHLAIYAELLDADAHGISWVEGAHTILNFDDTTPPDTVRRCWESHLERARWIVGEGLETAICAFNKL